MVINYVGNKHRKPNQRKPRNHEGGRKMTKRNISEWLNVIKLKVKDWEKIVKIYRTKYEYLYHMKYSYKL